MSGDPYGYDHDGDGWIDGDWNDSIYGYDFDGDGDIDADDDFIGDMMMYEAGACFIATAVYGDYDHPRVNILREFRDQVLVKSQLGRYFIMWYYREGPMIADWLVDRGQYKRFLKIILNVLGMICFSFLGK